ncbi:hypothetical protein [Nocardia farcinica]|uniref:hypothetical protein n=1 Tax=Nocardia farcinica TaxID=37329 RepID=UPI0018944044|nr:hypothetical protein [Nocardia farcinica]MBF6445158.1 hypothetical protein [Nocardia farcinica]
MARSPDLDTVDDTVAPLGVPAMITALGMLAAALLTADRLPDWADDYGGALVYLAGALYVAVSVRLLWWGRTARAVRVRRRAR